MNGGINLLFYFYINTYFYYQTLKIGAIKIPQRVHKKPCPSLKVGKSGAPWATAYQELLDDLQNSSRHPLRYIQEQSRKNSHHEFQAHLDQVTSVHILTLAPYKLCQIPIFSKQNKRQIQYWERLRRYKTVITSFLT